eukprot:15355-Heterococcus_DN1.PRE.1
MWQVLALYTCTSACEQCADYHNSVPAALAAAAAAAEPVIVHAVQLTAYTAQHTITTWFILRLQLPSERAQRSSSRTIELTKQRKRRQRLHHAALNCYAQTRNNTAMLCLQTHTLCHKVNVQSILSAQQSVR